MSIKTMQSTPVSAPSMSKADALKYENVRMLTDINLRPRYDSGTFYEVPWHMGRNPEKMSWCGYIDYDGALCDKTRRALNEAVHVEFSWCPWGFDCAQKGDYYITEWTEEDSEYRDYDYVINIIKQMCLLISNDPHFEPTDITDDNTDDDNKGRDAATDVEAEFNRASITDADE